jgi:hypothetical protein
MRLYRPLVAHNPPPTHVLASSWLGLAVRSVSQYSRGLQRSMYRFDVREEVMISVA